MNLNLLVGSGLSTGQTQTSGLNLEPQPTTTEIDEPIHMTKVAVPSSQIVTMTVAVPITLITLTMTTITTWPPLTLTTTRRTQNLRTVGLE